MAPGRGRVVCAGSGCCVCGTGRSAGGCRPRWERAVMCRHARLIRVVARRLVSAGWGCRWLGEGPRRVLVSGCGAWALARSAGRFDAAGRRRWLGEGSCRALCKTGVGRLRRVSGLRHAPADVVSDQRGAGLCDRRRVLRRPRLVCGDGVARVGSAAWVAWWRVPLAGDGVEAARRCCGRRLREWRRPPAPARADQFPLAKRLPAGAWPRPAAIAPDRAGWGRWVRGWRGAGPLPG